MTCASQVSSTINAPRDVLMRSRSLCSCGASPESSTFTPPSGLILLFQITCVCDNSWNMHERYLHWCPCLCLYEEDPSSSSSQHARSDLKRNSRKGIHNFAVTLYELNDVHKCVKFVKSLCCEGSRVTATGIVLASCSNLFHTLHISSVGDCCTYPWLFYNQQQHSWFM